MRCLHCLEKDEIDKYGVVLHFDAEGNCTNVPGLPKLDAGQLEHRRFVAPWTVLPAYVQPQPPAPKRSFWDRLLGRKPRICGKCYHPAHGKKLCTGKLSDGSPCICEPFMGFK